MKINTFLFFTIAILLSSCAKPTKLDTQAELYLRYDLQDRKLISEATFFEFAEGKKTTSKVFQSGVAFINSGMRTSTLPGGVVRYRYELNGNLPASNYFVWKKENGTEVKAEAQLNPIAEVKVANDQISRLKGFRFQFDGKPLDTTEKLVLVLVDANRKALNLEITGPSDGTNFEIAPGKFAGLANGKCQIDLVRTRTDTTQQAGTKIFLTSECYAKPVFAEIVD